MKMQFSLAPKPPLFPLTDEGSSISFFFPVAMRRGSSLKPGKVYYDTQFIVVGKAWRLKPEAAAHITSTVRSSELRCLEIACFLSFLQSGTTTPHPTGVAMPTVKMGLLGLLKRTK